MTLKFEKPEKRGPKPPKRIKRGGPIARSSNPIKRGKRPARQRKTPLAKLKRILWERVKLYVRETHGNTCYTCGAKDLAGSNWHTCHFINAGSSSMVRYDPDNLRPGCYRCNVSLRGNIALYAIRLLDEIGEAKWRSLLARSKVIKQWTRPDIEEMIAALDKGAADYELLYATKYALVVDPIRHSSSETINVGGNEK